MPTRHKSSVLNHHGDSNLQVKTDIKSGEMKIEFEVLSLKPKSLQDVFGTVDTTDSQPNNTLLFSVVSTLPA